MNEREKKKLLCAWTIDSILNLHCLRPHTNPRFSLHFETWIHMEKQTEIKCSSFIGENNPRLCLTSRLNSMVAEFWYGTLATLHLKLARPGLFTKETHRASQHRPCAGCLRKHCRGAREKRNRRGGWSITIATNWNNSKPLRCVINDGVLEEEEEKWSEVMEMNRDRPTRFDSSARHSRVVDVVN